MQIVWSDWIIAVSMGHLPRQWDDGVPLDVVGAPTDWDWTLNIQTGTALNVIPLGVTDGIVGTTLTKNQLGLAGDYLMQLVGVKDGVTRHTNLTRLVVPESLSGDSNWPELPTVFSEAVDRSEDAADRAESAATHGPRISGTNTWEVWDPDEGRYVDTMVDASGAKGPQGPAGDPGTDGITPTIGDNGNWYLGTTDTGKPSRGETGPRGPAGKDGTTDISLGLTSATVGQLAKITAVDANGKPTAWEPVDMPSGGDGEKEWTKIIDVEIAEKTGSFIADNLGGATEFHVRWSNLQNESQSDSGLNLTINGKEIGTYKLGAIVRKNGTYAYGWTYCKYDGLFWSVGITDGAISPDNMMAGPLKSVYNLVEGVGKANTLKLESPTTQYSPVSGKLEVWAR